MTRLTIAERLLRLSVDTETQCRQWVGSINHKGYGRITVDGRSTGAHRVAYETWVGPIPEGLEIDHLCRNRACIEPEHLQAVTHAENIARSVPWRPTHCPKGHEYIEGNVYRQFRRGYLKRACKACRNAQARKARARLKAAS